MSGGNRTTPEQRIANLRERLRDFPAEQIAVELRQSLRDSSNFVIEQVAKLSQKYSVSGIESELIQAYQRFAADGHECDKGCRAKLAIVEALLPLDFDDTDFWLAGATYQKPEPVWNGSVDTAADIRDRAKPVSPQGICPSVCWLPRGKANAAQPVLVC